MHPPGVLKHIPLSPVSSTWIGVSCYCFVSLPVLLVLLEHFIGGGDKSIQRDTPVRGGTEGGLGLLADIRGHLGGRYLSQVLKVFL